ncbi:histidine kinase [Vibrio tubiashii]|nr:histidine kinase [Vibrio tubiashii]
MATRIFPQSFTMQLTLLLCAVLSLGSLGWWLISTERLNQVLAEQVALRAQVQSQQLAQLPSLRKAVASQDAAAATKIIQHLQRKTDADFITVSDVDGIRLAHPVQSRVGLPVVGGDIHRALTTGESYLSHSIGSLGPSVRYVTPIFGDDGAIIGMIKVGYLKRSIAMLNQQTLSPLIFVVCGSLLLSWLAAWRFSRYVRDKMQHLEPWQLNQALQTSQGVLQATHEGVVAINTKGQIYLINDSAKKLLSIDVEVELPCLLSSYISESSSFALHGDDFIDRLVRVNGTNLVLTRVTLCKDDKTQGAVFSIRAQKELQLLSNKISQVSSYLDSIRVTRHEYQNKLSTLIGLLQLGRSDKALSLLLTQAQEYQSNIDKVAQLQSLPLVSGLLLSNIGKATEKGIQVDLSDVQGWVSLPERLSEQALSTLIGNLVNNSIEALKNVDKGCIRVAMYHAGRERVLSVANNGPIVNVSLEVLCRLGYTTKNDGNEHGIGMHLVQSIVEDSGGYLEMDSDESETIFSVYFPEVKHV